LLATTESNQFNSGRCGAGRRNTWKRECWRNTTGDAAFTTTSSLVSAVIRSDQPLPVLTGALVVSGGAGVAGNVNVNGNTSISGNNTILVN
jgi:hypothetical protein